MLSMWTYFRGCRLQREGRDIPETCGLREANGPGYMSRDLQFCQRLPTYSRILYMEFVHMPICLSTSFSYSASYIASAPLRKTASFVYPRPPSTTCSGGPIHVDRAYLGLFGDPKGALLGALRVVTVQKPVS